MNAPGLGFVLWLGWLALVRPGATDPRWPHALLVLAALVVIPLGLDVVRAEARRVDPLWRRLELARWPAAVLLAVACLFEPGALACALALPWLAVLSGFALLSLLFAFERAPSRTFAFVYAAVGAGWAVLDRAGLRPLGFDPLIVLLTALHFHYAGFALTFTTGLAARELGGRAAAVISAFVIAGLPLVAHGITATQLGFDVRLEAGAAVAMALGGLLSAGLHLRLALRSDLPRFGFVSLARTNFALAGLCLAGSMVLAALYGLRFFPGVPGLELGWMWAVHGSANALGFALPALLGWRLLSRAGRRPAPPER